MNKVKTNRGASPKLLLEELDRAGLKSYRQLSKEFNTLDAETLAGRGVTFPTMSQLGLAKRYGSRLCYMFVERTAVGRGLRYMRMLEKTGRTNHLSENWTDDRGFRTPSRSTGETYDSVHGARFKDIIDEMIAKRPGQPLRVLDVGAGRVFPIELKREYKDMIEVHVIGPVNKKGVDYDNEEVIFHKGVGSRLPFEDESFDLVLDTHGGSQYSRLGPEKVQTLNEECRVLAKGGKAFIADVFFTRDERNPDPEFDEAQWLFREVSEKHKEVRLEHPLTTARLRIVKEK